MWQNLFDLSMSGWEKVIRSAAVYLFLLVIFRIIGKRTIAAMSTMDFVLLFLLSNVVQNAVIGEDNTLLGGFIGALVIIGTNWLLDRLALISPAMRRVIVGRDVDVVTDGRVNKHLLRKIGLSQEQLEILVHMQNGDDIAQVQEAQLTADGHLLVRVKPAEQGASRGDIEQLNQRLGRIEELLAARA